MVGCLGELGDFSCTSVGAPLWRSRRVGVVDQVDSDPCRHGDEGSDRSARVGRCGERTETTALLSAPTSQHGSADVIRPCSHWPSTQASVSANSSTSAQPVSTSRAALRRMRRPRTQTPRHPARPHDPRSDARLSPGTQPATGQHSIPGPHDSALPRDAVDRGTQPPKPTRVGVVQKDHFRRLRRFQRDPR